MGNGELTLQWINLKTMFEENSGGVSLAKSWETFSRSSEKPFIRSIRPSTTKDKGLKNLFNHYKNRSNKIIIFVYQVKVT